MSDAESPVASLAAVSPDDREPAAPTSEPPSSQLSPVMRAGWLLRVTAGAAVIATVLGLIVAPGLQGVATDGVAKAYEKMAWASAYFMCGMVVTAIVLGSVELARASRVGVGARSVAIGASGAVIALASPALLTRLPIGVTIALASAACLVSLAAAWEGLRTLHTRAVAVVVGAFGVAAALRIVSWELATLAGDRANEQIYGVSRVIATGAVVFEALGQMIAAAWLGTRSRAVGQGLSSAAIGLAFVLTWGAAQGANVTAAPWQSALHTALANAPGLPPPYGLSALATFLVAASMLLALVSTVQPKQVVAVVCALALALIARGAFDVPLRALSAVAAGLWLMVATIDERAMWRTLLDARKAAEAEAAAAAAAAAR